MSFYITAAVITYFPCFVLPSIMLSTVSQHTRTEQQIVALPSIHSLLILVDLFRVASRISRSISVALIDDNAYTFRPAQKTKYCQLITQRLQRLKQNMNSILFTWQIFRQSLQVKPVPVEARKTRPLPRRKICNQP